MNDTLRDRARALGLHGLAAHWGEVDERDWPSTLPLSLPLPDRPKRSRNR